ncbi:MAG TPA: hypothetical protein VEK80_01770, partial [Kribbellaceae bacterium]|nr:hypothetical protein [Kribbellaceae bacterium]
LPYVDPLVVPEMPYMLPRAVDRATWPVITYDVVSYGAVALHVADSACVGTIVTVRSPAGAVRQITLNDYEVDFTESLGEFYAGIGEGGQWYFTAVQHGTTTVTLSPPRPFVVWLQSVVLLDHIPTVPAGRSVVVSGTAFDYTVDRVPVRSRNRGVTISSTDLAGSNYGYAANVVTDAAGRFSATVTATGNRVYKAELAARSPYTSDVDVTVGYVGGTGIQLGTALQVPAYQALTTVSGRTTPGGRTAVLELADPSAYEGNIEWRAVASAVSGTDGRFVIPYRPSWQAPMRMRVRLSGTAVADEFETSTVHRTALTAATGPTTARVNRPGMKMSTYGHLRGTYDNGTSGAYPNRQVVVQTRVRGVPGAAFHTVATARTTATGYFYANWTAQEDVDVRAAFLSTLRTVSWSFAPTGPIDVI